MSNHVHAPLFMTLLLASEIAFSSAKIQNLLVPLAENREQLTRTNIDCANFRGKWAGSCTDEVTGDGTTTTSTREDSLEIRQNYCAIVEVYGREYHFGGSSSEIQSGVEYFSSINVNLDWSPDKNTALGRAYYNFRFGPLFRSSETLSNISFSWKLVGGKLISNGTIDSTSTVNGTSTKYYSKEQCTYDKVD